MSRQPSETSRTPRIRLQALLGSPGTGPVERFRPTLTFLGLVLYLWVIHSAKAPLGTAAIVAALVGLLLHQYRLRVPLPLVLFGLYILWAAATSPMALYPEITSDRLVDYGKLWLIFLIAANVAHTPRQLHIVMVAWLGVYALYPVRGTLFNFFAGIGTFGRYAWNFIFSNPNDLAALTLPILALSIAVLQGERTRGWIRLSALAGVVVLPALIFLTQSRGGILALLTFGLLILVEYRRQARSLALGVLVMGVIALAAPPEVWDRLANLTKATDTAQLSAVDEEGSAEQRFEIWRVARAMIADHPVTGVGLGAYAEAHGEYARSGQFSFTARGNRDTHSLYLNAMAETGVIGFLILMGMFASVLVQARRRAHALRAVDPSAARQLHTLIVGLLAFLQAGVFASVHRVAFPYLYLGILTAAVAVFGRALQPARGALHRSAPLRQAGGPLPVPAAQPVARGPHRMRPR